ncbi:hypothetical protein AA0120_g2016 [Alternaria tenuissima]|jgi:hypothetical protein|nr:hypothetical protein AA0120_g2016 [Alternaria tenuissima]
MLYEYETLPSARSIRILTLCPAEQHNDAIECMIEATELEEASYDALSYSWGMNEDGDSSQDYEIFIHGNRKWVTRNLFEGLERIRVCDKPIRIWIDALCINQQDDVERSVQVAMMADIYARAEKVLVWLGNGTEEKEDLLMLELFHRIKKRTEQIKPWKKPKLLNQNCFVLPLLSKDCLPCPGCVAYQQSESSGGDLDDYVAHVDWLKECLRSNDSLKQTAVDMINMVIRFFSRRYWKRRWILQELFFSNTHYWYWGQHVLDTSKVPENWIVDLVFATWLVRYGLLQSSTNFPELADDDSFDTRTRGLSRLCNSQNHDTRTMERESWNWLLSNFRSSECSEPKDMYYALASMAIPSIRIDYSLTIAQVFQQFAETMLDNDAWIWVFYWATETPNNQESLRMPSWVPDPRLVNFDFGVYDTKPPMGIQISQRNSLVCDVRCLGVLRTHEEVNVDPDPHWGTHGFHAVWDDLFWQVCSSRKPSDEISEVIQPSPLKLRIDSNNAQSGDILCSCLEELTDLDVWIILRRKGETQTYELVGTRNPWSAYLKSLPMEQREQSFSKCPKIKMRIV